MILYSIVLSGGGHKKSSVTCADLLQAAQFVYGPRGLGARMYIKRHTEQGTNYIPFNTLREQVVNYLHKAGLTINDIYPN